MVEWEQNPLTTENPLFLLSMARPTDQAAGLLAQDGGTGHGAGAQAGMEVEARAEAGKGQVAGAGTEAAVKAGMSGVQLSLLCHDGLFPAPMQMLPGGVRALAVQGGFGLLVGEGGDVQLWDVVQSGVCWTVRLAAQVEKESGAQPSSALARGTAQGGEGMGGWSGTAAVFLSERQACVAVDGTLMVCMW